MRRIVLTRHGETVWHAENRYAGSSDVGLTERGRRQAAALGDWAATAGLSAVYSSDLTRCRDTAAPAAAALEQPVRTDRRLRELDFGKAEGRTLAELRADEPDAVEAFLADPGLHPLPGGEPPAHAVERARSGLADIAAAHPDSRVLVVMHSTLLRLVLCDLLGLPLGRYRVAFPSARNVGLTELSWPDGVLVYNAELPGIAARLSAALEDTKD